VRFAVSYTLLKCSPSSLLYTKCAGQHWTQSRTLQFYFPLSFRYN